MDFPHPGSPNSRSVTVVLVLGLWSFVVMSIYISWATGLALHRNKLLDDPELEQMQRALGIKPVVCLRTPA